MKVCVLGMGYIGLPMAAIMATRGIEVHGVDVRHTLIDSLKSGHVPIEEPGLATVVNAAINSGRLQVALEPCAADFFVIAVPTPFKKAEIDPQKGYREADLSYIESAARAIVPHLQAGNTVILESTSPPGTTRNVLAPILETSGLAAGKDFYLAYSPERVIPGDILKEMISNDRVVGGITKESAVNGALLYREFIDGTVYETDCTTAEMVKLSENTFRDVNIALANELAAICSRVGADVWDVVSLANNHPRVNLHRPGPGVGGHCIAVDPWFLVETYPEGTPLIRAARQVNDGQPGAVVKLVEKAVANHGEGAILFLGVSYKANVDDVREAPSLEIIRHFVEAGKEVLVCDPHVQEYQYPLEKSLKEAVARSKYVVILVSHREFAKELNKEVLKDKVVIDTQNVTGQMNLSDSTALFLLGRRTVEEK